MQITIAIALYVLGCVLAYGRMNSSRNDSSWAFKVSIISWYCFFVGLFLYISFERKQGIKFLKF